MERKKQRTLACIAGVILLLCGIAAGTILMKKLQTEYIAVITLQGENHAEVDEAFLQDYDCRKGDVISFGDVGLEITDISSDGNVSFNVRYGKLYTQEHEPVQNGILVRSDNMHYRTENGTVALSVTNLEAVKKGKNA